MAGEFTVKILQPEEFEKLPFKRIQENPSAVMGAADKKNRIAYVRDTGFNDFTKANIGHELDELMQQTSPHEEDGIRYKDFSQSFGNFLGNAPVIGKPLGALGRFAGSGIDKIGSLTGNAFNIGNPSVTQFGNQVRADKLAGFGTGSGASSSLLPGGPPGTAGGPPITSNPFSTFPSISIPPFPGIRGAGGASNVSTPNFFDSVKSGFKNVFTGQGGGTGGGGSNPFNFGETVGKALPGAAVALLGNLFAPKVEAPDFSGIRSDLEGRIGAGGSPAFDLGFGEAQKQLAGSPTDLPPEIEAEIDLRRDEEIRALENRFRGAQGIGGLSESDTSRMGTLRAEIVQKFEAEKQKLILAKNQQRIQTMAEVLRLDSAQFEQYTQLANLDVQELMIKTGVDAQTATEFKTLFGNIGGQLIDSAVNPNSGGRGGVTINV